jgi:hypothetical protein
LAVVLGDLSPVAAGAAVDVGAACAAVVFDFRS